MTDQTEPESGSDQSVGPLLTLTEAAALTGRPAEAIRTMIRRRKLAARKGNDGRWLVEIPVEMRRPGGQEPGHSATSHQTRSRQLGERGQSGHDQTANLSLQEVTDWLTGLKMTASELRLETDTWRDRVEQETLARTKAEARLEAMERAHAAEIASLQQQIETEIAARNAVIEELRAMLGETRKPFWRRWLGT